MPDVKSQVDIAIATTKLQAAQMFIEQLMPRSQPAAAAGASADTPSSAGGMRTPAPAGPSMDVDRISNFFNPATVGK